MCNLLSLGTEEDPEVMSMNGAAAALSVSSIPWGGPLGTARVCMVGDRLVANPPRGVVSSVYSQTQQYGVSGRTSLTSWMGFEMRGCSKPMNVLCVLAFV